MVINLFRLGELHLCHELCALHELPEGKSSLDGENAWVVMIWASINGARTCESVCLQGDRRGKPLRFESTRFARSVCDVDATHIRGVCRPWQARNFWIIFVFVTIFLNTDSLSVYCINSYPVICFDVY